MNMKDSPKDMQLANIRRRIMGESGLGTPDAAITQLYRGYDHRQSGSNFQKDIFNHGYVFYTRPLLNLSYDNINADPLLSVLLDDDPKSPFRYIRAILDPMGNYKSSLLHNDQAFIPLLTNTCVSHSGWPDLGIDSYVAPEGLRRESWAMGESLAEYNGTIDLSASFDNSHGNMLMYMFHCWIKYIGAAKHGELEPYPAAWMTHYLDYVSRCWRVVLDKTKTYVVAIATSVASYPENAPLGAQFNFNKESVFPQDTDQISIQWKSMAIEYNYEHLIDEFNENVCYFNPHMRDNNRKQKMNKVSIRRSVDDDGVSRVVNELNLSNFENLYPRINPKTREFEWWMHKQEYLSMRKSYELD